MLSGIFQKSWRNQTNFLVLACLAPLILADSVPADEIPAANFLAEAPDQIQNEDQEFSVDDLPPALPLDTALNAPSGNASVGSITAAPQPVAPKKPAPPVFPGPKTLPPTGPWKPLFFDNDFSYMATNPSEYHLGQELKNMKFQTFGETLTISTGGEIRHRFVNEDNRLRPGGPVHAEYNLWRWRHYVDAKYGDLRIYAEGIEADSFGSIAPDQPIDVNRWDIQNLFVDYLLYQEDGLSHTIRYGRQELLFGRQRLVSPLDWANTRRNFEGLRYLIKGNDFKLDVFATHPVNSATGYNSVAVYDSRFDQPNYHVWFSGAYFTYSGIQNTVIDTYWLYLDTTNLQDPNKPDGERHLFGSRYARLIPVANDSRVWDIDTEGGIQTGHDNGATVLAGFYTYVFGHTWKKAPLTPRLSHTFYYGSGDQVAGNSHNNTFNTLFPLGHAYWAISDNLSGENLYNWAIQADVKPTQKTAITTAYHWFQLASNGDKAYNVGGVPVGTPGKGRDLGQALDLYGYYSVNANFDVQLGYSWFWYGDFIQQTTPRGDATQFYVQTSFRY